jgi:hypothetical protein
MVAPSSADWDGQARKVGDLFRVHSTRCGRQMEAICGAWSHRSGWEVRLEIGGSVQRSQICGSRDELLEIGERWQLSLIEKGWN